MKPGRVAMVVVGALLALLGFALLAGGGLLGWAFATQRDDGYFHTPTERYRTDTHALTSAQFEVVDLDDLPSFVTSDDFGRVRLRTESRAERAVFVGIGPRAAVREYLAGVGQAEVADVRFGPFDVDYRVRPGGAPPTPPDRQTFWASSTSGAGPQELVWDLEGGDWTVVVMNADGGAGVDVDLEAGVRLDIVGALAIVLGLAGIVVVAFGVPLLVAGATSLSEHGPPPPPTAPITSPPPPPPIAAHGETTSPLFGPREVRAHPVQLRGELDPDLSRWLWLVKWVLAIPHVVVLVVLWLAVVVLTVVAGFAVLFTGRYPRPLFDFTVGVLRWSWRVGFYGYSALGTDRYPPFMLARTDYPADLEIEYPEELSRPLVLVKWWLLALPHLLVVALLTSAGGGLDGDAGGWPPGGLIGLLVFFAAVALLFTGRYPRGLFDLVVGLNRWVFRVAAYVLLLRDEYPPFRLDQGGAEPKPRLVIPPPPAAPVPSTAPTAADAAPRPDAPGPGSVDGPDAAVDATEREVADGDEARGAGPTD